MNSYNSCSLTFVLAEHSLLADSGADPQFREEKLSALTRKSYTQNLPSTFLGAFLLSDITYHVHFYEALASINNAHCVYGDLAVHNQQVSSTSLRQPITVHAAAVRIREGHSTLCKAQCPACVQPQRLAQVWGDGPGRRICSKSPGVAGSTTRPGDGYAMPCTVLQA